MHLEQSQGEYTIQTKHISASRLPRCGASWARVFVSFRIHSSVAGDMPAILYPLSSVHFPSFIFHCSPVSICRQSRHVLCLYCRLCIVHHAIDRARSLLLLIARHTTQSRQNVLDARSSSDARFTTNSPKHNGLCKGTRRVPLLYCQGQCHVHGLSTSVGAGNLGQDVTCLLVLEILEIWRYGDSATSTPE